ncbi:hypothetical protein TNCV_1679591 [Trichonephila clavipes]|nr:hypothetical protein TNCV_1679591 [Trichonephila clavipes]
MAYLGKARKEDLRLLAEELNLNVRDNMKIADLSKLITTHPDYDEEFSKNLLTIIVEDRKLGEQQEVVLKQLGEQQERLDPEFQLEKLRLENERLKGLTSTPENKAKSFGIEKRHLVSALMPSETNQLMAREAEEKFDDYDYIKDLLLKRATCGSRECPKNTRKTPPRNARSNIITAKGTELEFTKEVVTAKVSIPVSVPINTRNGIDDLQLVDIKC